MAGPPADWQAWRDSVDLDEYERRWQRLAAEGGDVHGEADLVARLGPSSVLDAGCGMGRVAIELRRRGIDVVGVDLDDEMLARARRAEPALPWVHADLAGLAELDVPPALPVGRRFDVVVLAGNVVAFVDPPDRPAAIAGCAARLAPGGQLISGFSLRPGWPALEDYDRWCRAAGLEPEARLATWDGDPWVDGGDYAVSVHRQAG